MRRILLWDFDATLADGPALWSRAARALARRAAGREPDLAELREELRKGFPWHFHALAHAELFEGRPYWDYMGTLFNRVLGRFGIPARADAALGVDVRDWMLLNHGYQPVPHLIETLRELSGRGYRHVIASNHIPELASIVSDLELTPHVERIYTSGLVGYEKPNERFFRHILDHEGADRIACMIGDNLDRDVSGAESVGVPAVWFDRKGDKPDPHPSVRRIASLAELPGLLPSLD